ncbi:ABC transporter ATP-binding protein [Flammeovirga agarivorans]|uniref:ABC transporter ATP-binding protein n=1 Tax=Flammeovirga agarivorans TaxID=2726742 RepID=A0A7X8XW76_9BACT|nr:ABC transporter ATP-binding protein [Flammeovirga agarivorans]NLR92058.1 ABC transporter ATP-binding protein [Flammeovirga agarivorans]
MNAVEVKNLKKSYGDVEALKGISFDVKENEIFGLIGPDGAGKTTLIRILASLLIADSGTVSVIGKDPDKDYAYIRNHIGYMPGKFSLYEDLSIKENLEFFATMFGTTIAKSYDLIKDIYQQIEPFNDRKAGALSGGMKQKLALSAALIHYPKILFLDEPTTGVDPVSRKEFWQIIKGLHQHNITIVVSTPYMDEADLCDRVALMDNGKILGIDTPQNVAESFDKILYAIEVKGSNYQLLKALRKFPNMESVFPFGEKLHYTDKREGDYTTELTHYLTENQFEEVDVKIIKSNTEDVFIRLMNKKDK